MSFTLPTGEQIILNKFSPNWLGRLFGQKEMWIYDSI
jgi:hypothetical protein